MSRANVVFDGTPTITAQDAELTMGPDPVTLMPTGTNVSVINYGATGMGTPRLCDSAWVTL